jgi:prevent-host-death family protein
MSKWQLQEAKARLSEVVKRAGTDGPQMITHRGKDAAVVISADEYRRLTGKKKDFVEFLLSGPKWGDDVVDLINERSKDTGRKIDL